MLVVFLHQSFVKKGKNETYTPDKHSHLVNKTTKTALCEIHLQIISIQNFYSIRLKNTIEYYIKKFFLKRWYFFGKFHIPIQQTREVRDR